MKVAVIFTGALRTIKKTMRYFKQNVLLNSDVDVFACVQNDTGISNNEWELWIREEIGSHLKHIQWFSLNDHGDWLSIRNKLMMNLNLAENWKQYLLNSGSIIEYYQLYLAYLKMCSYEDTHQRYQYIIRSRTDTIFAKPIDFHWLNWTDSDVEKRLEKINNALSVSGTELTALNTFTYFMNTIFSDDIIPNIQNIWSEYRPPNCPFPIPQGNVDINNYIKNGRYILVLRANNLYAVNREFFNLIPTIPFIYGFLKPPVNDGYWFNSENQFQAACYFSGLAVFSYNTEFEDKSLYEYDEARYFNSEYNIINPCMLYCVVRK
jgi:hypothetical protein